MIAAIRHAIKEILKTTGIEESRIKLYPTPMDTLKVAGKVSCYIHLVSDNATVYNQRTEPDTLSVYRNEQRWLVFLVAPYNVVDNTVETIKKAFVFEDLVLNEDPEDTESPVQRQISLIYQSAGFVNNPEVAGGDLQEVNIILSSANFTNIAI